MYNLIKDPIYKEKYSQLVFVRIVKYTNIKSSITTKNGEGNKNGDLILSDPVSNFLYCLFD